MRLPVGISKKIAVAALLGFDYRAAVPKAGKPLPNVTEGTD